MSFSCLCEVHKTYSGHCYRKQDSRIKSPYTINKLYKSSKIISYRSAGNVSAAVAGCCCFSHFIDYLIRNHQNFTYRFSLVVETQNSAKNVHDGF